MPNRLKDRPEGICVYAKADTGDHAILITTVDEGSFKVIDAIDGGSPREFGECSAVNWGEPTSIFYKWTTEKLLSRIKWVKYIE